MPFGPANSNMRSMIDPKWPRCPGCEQRLSIGVTGFLCLDCNGPSMPFEKSEIVSHQVSPQSLRELFPARVVSNNDLGTADFIREITGR